MWIDYDEGKTIGTVGSENGEIVYDIEYNGSARITVECCERYYGITVGIYGSMVHTVFCNGDEYPQKVTDMKKDIECFCGRDNTLAEINKFCGDFYKKY